MAIAAHPDDIEFLMAGTLRLLAEAGHDTHYLTVANGSLGTFTESAAAIRRVRRQEARTAAGILGARFHDSLCDDFEILYSVPLIRRLSAVVREVAPSILLIPSPQDYMEDHTTTCRLATIAAFGRNLPNLKTTPPRPPTSQPVTLYHAMPHGLRDPLRRLIVPGAFVDTAAVHAVKQRALAAHRSQQEYLSAAQDMPSHVETMDRMSREVGAMSGRFTHAEGWRRHLHLGFCRAGDDPLRDALGDRYLINAEYERGLT